ncbi:hypothetical protein SLEP1_g20550 [Rubroshorea leprosula]|uniref:Secreted protein n=1 Tax=Rubroshorea leprosula TaxID=152421 RepID=A0AAV5JC16_9ROSI|nr:hypothetical protein SLEP1_g20550 [Rubroshorea leprosula]
MSPLALLILPPTAGPVANRSPGRTEMHIARHVALLISFIVNTTTTTVHSATTINLALRLRNHQPPLTCLFLLSHFHYYSEP